VGRRQRVVFVLRIVASAVMLALLLSRVDVSSLVPQDHASALPWVAAGLVTMLAAVVLSSLRWQRVLTALDLPSEFPPLLSHSLAGLFVANFLPSTIGGDVLRVARLSAANGQAPASFASVVLERLTGFLVLPLITLLALFADPGLLRLGMASRLALLFSLGTLALLVVILAVAGSPRLGRKLAETQNWLRFAGAVHLGLHRIRRHPAAAAGVLVTALAYQMTIIVVAWLAARALGIDVGWAPVMAFIPVVAMAQVLPVSVNGLGLREGALVLLLQPLGVATTEAVALGLLLYGINLVVSLLGAPAFAVGTRPVRPARAAA
jgi:uncharacterized membrane protein YbhN (UPF0104 family)